MMRPSIIRADTIDLQDPAAPSAQDHPYHAPIPGTGPTISGASIAPHQAETLREVAQETAEAESQNPTVPWSNGSAHEASEIANEQSPHGYANDTNEKTAMYQHKQQDDLAIAQNGGVSSADEEDMEGESGSDMDDDMMDKISSSPSIEDGALYPAILPVAWPRRESSLTLLPRQLSPASMCFGSAFKQASKHCCLHRLLHYRGTSVSRQGKKMDVADWQRCPGHKPRLSLRRPPSELDKCEWVHGGPSVEQEKQKQRRHDHSLTHGAELGHFEAWLSRKPYHQIGSRHDDTQILLHRKGLRDTVSQAHQVPLDWQFGAESNGVIDQLAQSIDSLYYGGPLIEEVEACSDDECLLDSEDIDFEFVYALHTFVATVEGQANATKGDTMVLLDDSNSYWWLVRVVKDSSIGYLPAEHIETPTERLARLNKHRNIDLSATMLGDQAQKQKNSFPSIRRRRKTVAFSEPTYVDYSDFDYSSDEEDDDELFGSQPTAHQHRERQRQVQQSEVEDASADEAAAVEPLKTRTHRTAATQSSTEAQVEDEVRSSQESLEGRSDSLSRSRNGTVRNTDSFFKDDSVETKKITLTPNLLRDDNTLRQPGDSATKDAKSASSMDKIDRELVSDREKKRLKDKDKEKREKEKKSSGLRGFFSRKDRKKMAEDDDESFGKRSLDLISEARNSEDRSLDEQRQVSPDMTGPQQRQPGRLQKNVTPTTSKSHTGAAQKPVELSSYLAEGRNNDVSNVPPMVSMRIVGPEPNEAQQVSSPSDRSQSLDSTAPKEERSANSNFVSSSTAGPGTDAKPQKMTMAHSHVDLDASDTSEPESIVTAPRTEPARETTATSPKAGALLGKPSPSARRPVERTPAAATATTHPAQQAQHVSQSPKQGISGRNGPSSPSHASHPPALMVDTSSVDDISPEASPSPELVQPESDIARGGSSSAGSGKEAAWDDNKLRAFFDESDHIRDLLVVVYDKTNVEPAGNDHPVVGGLFREQNAKLAEITTQLDNMLGDWLARKQRRRGTS
ncbi:hypothetical protein E4U36_004465 [Claviceps purpurea]|nr:hypothetical protein E4U28_006270 [Claviceps purpurea]KAG6168395.1 hypothetical protein E4U51_002214 [Claviceps purpurea]KAG6180895.1 hypothetical protein E4U36_004465 [Claviceps purpurea]